jgi:hypothetical protein
MMNDVVVVVVEALGVKALRTGAQNMEPDLVQVHWY